MTTGLFAVNAQPGTNSYAATLSSGTPYKWDVAACNSAGCSGRTIDLYFQTPGSKPPTPTSPSPGSTSSPGPTLSSTTVTITWGSSNGATYYDLGVRDMTTGLFAVNAQPGTNSYAATLSSGTPYKWDVAACNSAGCSGRTIDLYFQTPGSATTPSPLSPGMASAPGPPLSTTTPTFTWTGIQEADGYRLYLSELVNGSYSLIFDSQSNVGHPLTGTSYLLPAGYLHFGGQYSWRIASHNSAGYGDPSTNTLYFEVQVDVAPPGSFSLTGSDTCSNGQPGVGLDWSSSSNADSYSLYRDGQAVGAEFGSSTTSFLDIPGVAAGKQYTYKVRASNQQGSIDSNTIVIQVAPDVCEAGTPTADFDWNPQRPQPHEAVQFTDHSKGANLDWEWDFNGDGQVDSASQNPSTSFSSSGPHQVALAVSNAYGVDRVVKTVEVAAVGGTPAVTRVERQYPGVFLQGTPYHNRFDLDVAWSGNPGRIDVAINGKHTHAVDGSSRGGSFTLDLSNDLSPAWRPSVVSFTAINSSGIAGTPWQEPVFLFPYPPWLTTALEAEPDVLHFSTKPGEVLAIVNADFPERHLSGVTRVPDWVPYFGGDIGLLDTFATLRGSVSSIGQGQVMLAGSTGFEAMSSRVAGHVGGRARFRLFEPAGLTLQEGSFSLDLEGTLAKDVGLVEAIPALSGFANWPPIKYLNDRVKLRGEASPSLHLTALFEQDDTGHLSFAEGTGTLELELKGTLQACFVSDHVCARAWLSGDGAVRVGVPEPLLRHVELTFEAGAEVSVDAMFRIGPFDIGAEDHHTAVRDVGCVWDTGPGWSCTTTSAQKSLAEALPSSGIGVAEVRTPYSSFGEYEVFHRKPISPDNTIEGQPRQATGGATLVTNLFPGASPHLLRLPNGEELLLWVRQDPDLPIVQSTDIFWSSKQGQHWSHPLPIISDTRVELSPVAGVDSAGNVVAAWLRIKDRAFGDPIHSVDDLPRFYKELELVYAVFDPRRGIWSDIKSLTDDSAMQTDLYLSSDRDGNLALTWLSNEGGEFIGTADDPQALWYARWTGSSWTAPSRVADGLVGTGEHSATVLGDKVVIALATDIPVSGNRRSVIDVFQRQSNGTWSNDKLPSSSASDRHPQVAFDQRGRVHVAWLRGNTVLHSVLGSSQGTETVIGSSGSSLGFSDLKLMTAPGGEIAIVWPESQRNRPATIMARIFDPYSSLWSGDLELIESGDLMHNFSGFLDNTHTLQGVFLATKVLRTTREVSIGGQRLTIHNVPEDGRTDLRVLEHGLRVDLSVIDSHLSVVPSTTDPQRAVTVTAQVLNAGDFSVGGFVNELYSGNPDSGGTLVGMKTVNGPLRAGKLSGPPLSGCYARSRKESSLGGRLPRRDLRVGRNE